MGTRTRENGVLPFFHDDHHAASASGGRAPRQRRGRRLLRSRASTRRSPHVPATYSAPRRPLVSRLVGGGVGTAASAAGVRSSGLTSTRRQRRQVGTGAGSLVSRADRAQHNEEGMGVGCRGSLARVARAPTISRRTSGPQTTTRSFGYCLCKVGHFHRRDAASTLHFGYALRRRPAARAVPGYACM